MIDRPMRQVSLRKFRGEIADLREMVEVSRRDGNGMIRVLGYWTPYRQPVVATHSSTAGADSEGGEYVRERVPILDIPVDADPDTFRIINHPDEVATAVRPDPIRAVPKPSQKKRPPR